MHNIFARSQWCCVGTKMNGAAMDKLYDTPIKAIRKKCLDCCCGSRKEVRECPVTECTLYPYRFGHRPTKAILDTIKQFRERNSEPANDLLEKTGTSE